ncbi:hypothetical protein HPP92_026140 [Vanilla planifolia]|uniref:Transcription factor n=1 Tax=Vanilla planifolia TaxID=51239 RepID=A0A835PHA0_VANPL|nr:hypothetical protein HPP92_026140 [Vanilla planifolia]
MNEWSVENPFVMEAFLAATDLQGLTWTAASVPQLPTFLPTVEESAASAAPGYFSQETLQQRLHVLIEGEGESWTYAIFWQSSLDAATGEMLLGWGDGYYKGRRGG